MTDPLKVTYQNLSASVQYYPSDGLFHAYWNIGGIKGKAASKTIEGAGGFGNLDAGPRQRSISP